MDQEQGRLAGLSRFISKLVTNLIKIAGGIIGVNECLQTNPDARVMVFAGFMIAGGTLSESVLDTVLDRVFGEKPK